MTILCDSEILNRCWTEEMIKPFEDNPVRQTVTGEKIVSYGVGSYGYDIRVDNDFKIFNNLQSAVIDPKVFDEANFHSVNAPDGVAVTIPPNSFALATSREYLKIPRDILVICIGKSTYARCGIIVNVTPLEPEWQGNITMEISNTTPNPARIYAGEGIAQLVFHRADEVCRTSYADKGGKYQGQKGITLPKV